MQVLRRGHHHGKSPRVLPRVGFSQVRLRLAELRSCTARDDTLRQSETVIEKIVIGLSSAGLSAVAVFFLIVYLLVTNYEGVQKWIAWIANACFVVFRVGERTFVTHDIEGRVNDFAKSAAKDVPTITPVGIKLRWTDSDATRAEFVEDGRMVIRMRRHENRDRNFVHASMAFIARTFLYRAKRYLSSPQKTSLDLYVGLCLMQKEKPHITGHFYDDFFGPQAEDRPAVLELVERYRLVDRVGLFYPVLVQELDHLGRKVFLRGRRQLVAAEARSLVEYLRRYADREVGDTSVPLGFRGAFCRCQIVIVARAAMVLKGDIQPYVAYIRKSADQMYENIYVLGPAARENWEFMSEIVRTAVRDLGLTEVSTKRYRAEIVRGGARTRVDNYFVHLRTGHCTDIYDSDFEKKYVRPALSADYSGANTVVEPVGEENHNAAART